jgi:hypothetical protein
LRHGWTKFWRCTSFGVAAFLSASAFSAQHNDAPKPLNELTLAGLRPGRDSLANALRHYKQKYLVDKTSIDSKEWRDTCTGHSLALALDSHSVIQAITVSMLVPRDGNCDNRRFEFLNLDDWITGKGLRLGDSRNHVVELYGEPSSSEPVVRDDADFELLQFDFAALGPSVPQQMQVYCERESGRVVEITLSASSHIETKRAQTQ